MQLLVEETLSKDSRSCSFENESEVSAQSHFSEDSKFVFEKYQNTIKRKVSKYFSISRTKRDYGENLSNRDACKIVGFALWVLYRFRRLWDRYYWRSSPDLRNFEVVQAGR